MKKELESLFDIPFHVEKKYNHYVIYPENTLGELFIISIEYRSNVRVVTEIKSQNHSKKMLKEMTDASAEKQEVFMSYMNRISEKGAKVESIIDGERTYFNTWPNWNEFCIRISKIYPDGTDFDESALEWATLSCGMMLSLLEMEYVGDSEEEGKLIQLTSNKYERSPVNRELCLDANGYICKICGFDFEKTYGSIGKHFIHVHHIVPVSQMGGEYKIDPIRDLIPVCPNCHAMLHRRKVPYSPSELKSIIKEQENK